MYIPHCFERLISYAALIGYSFASILLVGIYFLKYKIIPLQNNSAISLPFKNPIWIFKVRWYFTLLNISICWYGPVPWGYNFSCWLLFRLLMMLNFLWTPHHLPMPILSLPPLHTPLPDIYLFLFSLINSDLYWEKLYHFCQFFSSFLSRLSCIFVAPILWIILTCFVCFCWNINHTVLIGRFKLSTSFKPQKHTLRHLWIDY